MPKSASARLSDELHGQLEVFARANDLSISQAVRELLSRMLVDADPVTRGYREGVMRGTKDVFEAVQTAVAKLR